ncbi:hypothetical protein [Lysinibacillus fusiformis]|uniref:hypothetical protein n=1 Tax=Lysinibacillus fusiformis TaxID=28031 RepID=UPI00148E7D7A|nr:hypothetical protein [Lysinibacillus fusiformis]NOG28552.1 hypothetical protein [Lysinibacillus fusiformis]
MDQKQFNAIKERVAKTTPGEWKCINIGRGKSNYAVVNEEEYVAHAYDVNDTEFIAHARKDVPALVTEVESLNELRKDDFLMLCEARDDVRFMQKQVEGLRKALEKVMEVEAPIMEGWETTTYEIARQALGGESDER